MVDPRSRWSATRIPPRVFSSQIEYSLSLGFLFQTISDYLENRQEHTKRIAITFDDGYESVYEYAFPILKKFQCPATLFVNPAHIGQYNTWDVNLWGKRTKHLGWSQLEHLSNAGWEIGSHSFAHSDLTKIDEATLYNELELSKKILLNRLGRCSSIISYPFGNVNATVAQMCNATGYRFGLVMGTVRTFVPAQFSIPRTGIYLYDFKKLFSNKLQGKKKNLIRILQRIMDFCSDASVLVKHRYWLYD